MNPEPIPARRKFANEWDEIDYLRDKLFYWLYERGDRGRSRPYAERLKRLLPKADPGHDAILGEECWSLIHEAEGNLPEAIQSRENVVRLIRRLHEIARGRPYEDFATQGYGHDGLSDQLDLLAMLYHDNGDLDKAISTLQESQRLCENHGLTFDGGDLLTEYLEEKRNAGLHAEGRRRCGSPRAARGARGGRSLRLTPPA
jgi:hypothetical protein